MGRGILWAVTVVVTSLVACGGSCPPADAPAEAEPEPAAEAEPAADEEAEPAEIAAKDEEETAEEPPRKEEPPPAAEPEFPPNASVAEAIAAIPIGASRLNVEQEVLAEPLQEPSLYEPCKVGAQHFKLRVAVWGGRAVGIDVTTKNAALATCIKERILTVEWKDKVRSLNTVEFAM